MKLSLRLLLLLPFIFILAGCPNDDAPAVEIKTYAEVYAADIVKIEDFMDEHFITVDGNNNVTFTKITGSTPGTPISAHPNLEFKTISKGGVDHKLYFIKLAEGLGNTDTDLDTENDNPTKLDSVFTSYKGYKTDLTSFDEASSPIWLQLHDAIQGWQDVLPGFKIGNSVTDVNTGITTYSDFGAGIMFIPSGLAYFNQNHGTSISPYTPLIFSFKLLKLKYNDQDGDKILSKDEYLGTGLVSGTALDTDGDGKPDYGDFDDDNDGKLTKEEIRITPNVTGWYSFGSIPTCVTGGKKKHLDTSCQ